MIYRYRMGEDLNMKKIFTAIKQSPANICLIDKILILYMIILLAYTAVHLLGSTTMQESTTVDTIIRTSASAIFGYFISNNFMKSNSGTKSKNISDSDIENSAADKITITQSNIMKQDTENEKNAAANSNLCCSNLQIIVVSGIGLISLILLLVSRKFTQTTPEFSATVSQLRDFLSACIGFLVSCEKAK